MGASTCCAEAEADTQLTIFDLSALKKQCLILLSKGPLTVPSIIRRAQHENLTAVFERVKREDDFLQKWLEVEERNIFRQRKPKKQLVALEESQEHRVKKAACATKMPEYSFSKNYFSKTQHVR